VDVTDPDLSPVEFLQLIADPLRWQLLSELARSDRRVHELTALADRPQNVVSYHLRELRNGGLVTARQSSADGRDTYYRVDLARCGRSLAAAGGALHPGLRLAVPRTAARRPQCRPPRVLFLCTGNSARSQMAEALLVERSDRTVEARSAGSHPKALHPHAVRVMAERGIDISGHATKHHRRFARAHFSQVVTLCDRVREVCPELPGQPPLAHWSMADPAAEGGSDDATYDAFVRTADDLEERIAFLLPKLTDPSHEQELTHV
jgi:protein-tyrosine-phosphatase/DNA-binding transcriptional ArsR family regulator